MYQYQTTWQGDGNGIIGHGYLRRAHGRWYLDEIPLEDLLADRLEAFVEISVFRPQTFSYPIDGKIASYVKLLNSMGIPTLSSCEGHLEDGKPSYPYVICAEPVPVAFMPEGWECAPVHSSSWEVAPVERSHEALESNQKAIGEFA